MKLRVWNLERLAVELREERLTEGTKFAYLLSSVLLGLVVGGGGLLQMAQQPNGLIIWGMVTAVYIVGLIIAFRVNQSGDGTRFIERYICLGVPAFVRMLCLLYGAYLVSWIWGGEWMKANSLSVFYALAISSFMVFFWWIRQGFSIAATGSPRSLVL